MFVRKINSNDALFHKQMGQFARPPKTRLSLEQISLCRSPCFRPESLAKLFGVHPRETYMAKHHLGPYADIV